MIGICHICRQRTFINYCKLCGHWFCDSCSKRWGQRLSAFFTHRATKEVCCGPDVPNDKLEQVVHKQGIKMAKTIEQLVQDSLGSLLFQLLSTQSLLEAEKEKNTILTAELDKLRGETDKQKTEVKK